MLSCFHIKRVVLVVVTYLLALSSMAWAQKCTTDPFSKQILPLCDPGGDGDGNVTVGPEDLLDFVQSSNGSWQVVDVSAIFGVQVLGAPPSAILVNGEYHIYVPQAANAHIQEFIRSTADSGAPSISLQPRANHLQLLFPRQFWPPTELSTCWLLRAAGIFWIL